METVETHPQKKSVKFVPALIFILVILPVIYLILFQKKEEVHYHAAFKVYKNNQSVDFAQPKFMQSGACGDEVEITPEHEQLEKAHLHDNIGDIVHVHREGGTWRDLFKNIKYKVPSDSIVYVDGNKAEDGLSSPIKKYTRVLILVDSSTTTDIKELFKSIPSIKDIKENEKFSETCGT
jgi:hypothetical protein